MKRHHVELAYAQGHLYARCRCGWEGTRRPSPGGERSDAYWAAERDAVAHEHAPGSVGVPYGPGGQTIPEEVMTDDDQR